MMQDRASFVFNVTPTTEIYTSDTLCPDTTLFRSSVPPKSCSIASRCAWSTSNHSVPCSGWLIMQVTRPSSRVRLTLSLKPDRPSPVPSHGLALVVLPANRSPCALDLSRNCSQERTSVVKGERVSVGVDLGGRRIIKKKKIKPKTTSTSS